MNIGMRFFAWLAILLCVPILGAGCVALPTAPLVSSAMQPVSPTTPAPGPLSMGEPDALNSAPAGRLEVPRVPSSPRLDGQMDNIWATSRPVRIPLARGSQTADPRAALDVELRAVRTVDTLYFLARWHGEAPVGAADTTFNQLTIHWTIPVPTGSPAPACAVACHTAYVDGGGRVAYMNSETIPQGGEDALHAGGGWAQGGWSIAWSRPLVSENLYDLQFTDLSATYLFFVKIFERADGKPDAVSKPYALIFAP